MLIGEPRSRKAGPQVTYAQLSGRSDPQKQHSRGLQVLGWNLSLFPLSQCYPKCDVGTTSLNNTSGLEKLLLHPDSLNQKSHSNSLPQDFMCAKVWAPYLHLASPSYILCIYFLPSTVLWTVVRGLERYHPYILGWDLCPDYQVSKAPEVPDSEGRIHPRIRC